MALLRTLFWFAIFLISTFAFTVLFEHGTSNFAGNAEKQWQTLTDTVMGSGKKSPSKSAP